MFCHIYFTQMPKQLMNTTKSYFKTHWVKHSYFMQKIFILEPGFFLFKLPMIPSQIVGLHYELLFKWNMLIELCVGNHITSYGLVDALVNGANEIFKII
jgi:hypothetical protein